MNNADVSGDTVYVQGDASAYDIAEELHVQNNGGSALDVKVKKIQIQILSGSSNSFCWAEQCYPSSVIVSTHSQNIAAGAVTSGATDLSAHYSPGGNVGTSIIAYTAFDINNISDSTIVYVVYDAVTGIETASVSVFSGPVPNPASSIVTFNCDVKNGNSYSFNLYNLLGKVVYSKQLHSGQNKFSLNVSDLPEGIYVYSYLTDNKKQKTGRLIISH